MDSGKSVKDQNLSFTWIVPRIRSPRGENWKGDVLIADLEELVTMDASEIHSKRLNAKEIFPQKGESTFLRPRPNRGEGHIDFLGESERIFSTIS